MLKPRFPAFVAALVSASILFCAFSSCTKAVPPSPDADPAIDEAAYSGARAIAASMSDEELAGQVMIIGVEGSGELSNGSRSILRLVRPGAVILFGFNVSEDPRSVASLSADIRTAVGVPSPFVAIDHEGGGVFRFKGGLTRLPSAAAMGRAGTSAATAAGAAAGSELRALGVTMNAAPVVEALTEANRAFLVDRAWSADPAASGILAAAFIEACQSSGAAAVAKHFPGNAAADPHRGLPVLAVPRAELEGAYLAPFRRAIGAGVAAIMLSHALVPAIDPDLPVSLSPRAIALLKDELGFRGIVLTDDLQMAALSGRGGVGEAAIAALSAGADMVMVSGGRTARDARAEVLAALADGRLARSRLEDAAARVIAQKLRFGLDAETEAERASRLESLAKTVDGNRAALSGAMAGEE